MENMQIITKYGTMWARNSENIKAIPGVRAGGVGVYILFDGSMPVYVGKGNIKHRIIDARRSKRRGQLWDRFSWYAVADVPRWCSPPKDSTDRGMENTANGCAVLRGQFAWDTSSA